MGTSQKTKRRLPRGKCTDEELRQHGYKWVWIFWAVHEVELSIRWRGRVIRFVEHLFETDDRATAEMLVQRDDVEYEGIRLEDSDGRPVYPFH